MPQAAPMAVPAVIAGVGVILGQRNASKARQAQQRQLNEQRDISRANALANVDIAHMSAGNDFAYAAALGGSVDQLFESAAKYREAADQTLALSHKNASLIRREGAEDVRRTNIGQEFTQGLTLAYQAGGGGSVNTGSNKAYFENMVSEDSSILSFMNAATQSRASIEIARGEYERQIGLANADSVYASALGQQAEIQSIINSAHVNIAIAQAGLAGFDAPAASQVAPATRRPDQQSVTGPPRGGGGV